MGKFRAVLVALALAVLGTTTAACSQADPDTEPIAGSITGPIIGTWVVTDSSFVVAYKDDGTYTVSESAAAPSANLEIPSKGIEFGTWSIGGNVLTHETDSRSPACPRTVGSYEIEFDDTESQVGVTVIDDPCLGRAALFLPDGGLLVRAE